MRYRGFIVGVASGVALVASGCGLLVRGGRANESPASPTAAPRPVQVEMPWETTAVRDDRGAPVLSLAWLDNGAGGVAVPYVYGYPIYPHGDAARGVLKLRHDNWTGATQEETEDEAGVVHFVEQLPQLGCRFEGIKETPDKLVPLSLTCELPAPKGLGGGKRPVLGSASAGAKASELLAEDSVKTAFLGQWHLTSGELEQGQGLGYFNTDHGQLAFGFERGRLARFVYYFDPGVREWQSPLLWVSP